MDPSLLDTLSLGVLKSGPAPLGGVLGPDLPDNCILMHVEAGRLRRIHKYCKEIALGNGAASSSGQAPNLDLEGAPSATPQ